MRRSSSLFGPDVVLPAAPRGTSGEIGVDLPSRARAQGVLTPGAVRAAALATILVGIVIVIRLVELQVREGAMWRAYAEGNRLRVEIIPARRGIVRDRYGNALADNVTALAVVADARRAPRAPDARAAALAVLTSYGVTVGDDVRADFVGGSALFSSVILSDEVAAETAVRVMAHQDQFPWIRVVPRDRRRIIDEESLAHVVGYVGKLTSEEWERLEGDPARYARDDTLGKSGVEKRYEALLRGMPGRRQIEVNARGQGETSVIEEPPRHGADVTLTIDEGLQAAASRALARAITAVGGNGGAAVALDPRTGEVRALVSLPAFRINEFAGGDAAYVARILADPQQRLFNRVLAGQYPIGSTIKPMIAAATLQEGVVEPRTKILSTGGLRVGDWFFPDWKAGGHGWVDVYGAMAESVNTYFYVVGGGFEDRVGLGIERMARYARAFGLGEAAGIDLPGEREGFIPTPEWKERVKGEPWYVGDTYHFAIGQGDVLATPLQVARMTAAFANGGYLVTPHVVMREEGDVPLQRIGSVGTAVLDVVKAAMRQTVTDGSARALGTLPVAIAGKTGTAQAGGGKPPHAWFTGFAPYQNPEIVVTVLVEYGGEGSAAAVPVAHEIFQWWVAYGTVSAENDS